VGRDYLGPHAPWLAPPGRGLLRGRLLAAPCNTGATKPRAGAGAYGRRIGSNRTERADLPHGAIRPFSVRLLRDELVEEVDVRRAPLHLLRERLHGFEAKGRPQSLNTSRMKSSTPET
jgi:hypothetical protein